MNKINLIRTVWACVLGATVFSACNRVKVTRTDTATSGTAQVVCDEGFSKILFQEAEVYESRYDSVELQTVITNEVETINLLLKDSIRLAFAFRELTAGEAETIKKNHRTLRSQKVAVDGIALIINKENTDSLIGVPAIRDILAGKIRLWSQVNPISKSTNHDSIKVVFDNPNSSTVRYLKDTLARGGNLYAGLRSLSNSEEVLDYVANNRNALGIISVSWISNPNDTTNLSFSDKVRVMSVSYQTPAFVGESYAPYAAYLALGKYPLTRDVFMLLTDVRGGLPAGFASFVGGDTGQRIILRGGLVPATRPMRLVALKDEM